MKILLTRPTKHISCYTNLPDLGLGYLATALRNRGHSPAMCIPGGTRSRVLDCIEKHKIDVVGMKLLTSDISAAFQMVEAIRKRYPDIPIILGGPHVSGVREDIFNIFFPKLKYAFAGEGEVGLPMLIDTIKNPLDSNLGKIPNLIWRKDDGSIVSNAQHFAENLDGFGFPAWDLMEPEKGMLPFNMFFSKRHPVVGILSSRGCPARCTFCAAHLSEGRRFRTRTPHHVVDEIEFLIAKHGIKEVQFWDSNCINDNDRMIAICKEIIRRELKIVWSCPNGVRLNSINNEVCSWMRKAGCHFVMLGIETGSERVQERILKGVTIKSIPKKIKILRQNNINIGAYFMIGFPEETKKEVEETIALCLALDLDAAAFSIFVPLPGTNIFNDLSIGLSDRYEDVLFQNAANDLSRLSSKELLKIAGHSYLRFWLRRKPFFYLLRNLNSAAKWRYVFTAIRGRIANACAV